jgi:hypothetical protein
LSGRRLSGSVVDHQADFVFDDFRVQKTTLRDGGKPRAVLKIVIAKFQRPTG